jgi:putative hydrolase of the HAD superfamily
MRSTMSYTDEITTLAFDWGGTLMLEDPRFDGPMEDWPQVAAVDGARQALETLRGHYQMVVLTNAAASNAEKVRRALARVGLDVFFSQVFTFQELQARKPDLRFFRGVENALGLPPHRLLMVGDDFWADVAGACGAGWRSAWLNPSGAACPGLLPPHSAELSRLEQLPEILSRPLLPDLSTCHLWCLEQGFSFDAWQHVLLVAAIAYQGAAWLRAQGLEVDPILAQRGGLLHDLAKFTAQQINASASHAEVGTSLLRDRDQPRLAEIARCHPIRLADSEPFPRTWEEKLVHFADRLADSSRLVRLDERLRLLSQRYPHNAGRMLGQRAYEESLQAEIAAAADFASPVDLFAALQSALKGS